MPQQVLADPPRRISRKVYRRRRIVVFGLLTAILVAFVYVVGSLVAPVPATAAVTAHDRLDIVFANAGIDSGPGFVSGWAGARERNPEGALENYADERWNRVIDINLNGIFATARAAARHMRPRKFGRIVITTSLWAATSLGVDARLAPAPTRSWTGPWLRLWTTSG